MLLCCAANLCCCAVLLCCELLCGAAMLCYYAVLLYRAAMRCCYAVLLCCILLRGAAMLCTAMLYLVYCYAVYCHLGVSTQRSCVLYVGGRGRNNNDRRTRSGFPVSVFENKSAKSDMKRSDPYPSQSTPPFTYTGRHRQQSAVL